MILAYRVLIFCFLVSFVGAASGGSSRKEAVQLWSPADVELWVNNTIGLPEYAEHFRAHVVDGPTLLAMEVEDLEDSMPLTNRLHAAKFRGHLQLLKDQCLCPQAVDDNFWSYVQRFPYRVWVYGAAAIYAPRAALIGAYLFENSLYQHFTFTTVFRDAAADDALVAVAEESSWLLVVLFWVGGLLFPYAYLLLHWVPHLGTNPFVVLPLAINFIVGQYHDVMIALTFIRGDFGARGVVDKLLLVFPIPTALPLVTALVGLIMPVVVLKGVVALAIIYSLFVGVGFVMMLRETQEGAAEEAQTAPPGAEKEKTE